VSEVETLRAHVGAARADESLLRDCIDEATALVDRYIADHIMRGETVPDAVERRAVREVAADLFHRRKAPNGIINQQFDAGGSMSSTPIRIARDPMAPAYPILAAWMIPVGFA